MSVIEVDAVSKWFGDVVAVSEVSFSLDVGVTALLGPNGAGKSTMLRLLCGLTRPSQGTVRMLGEDPNDNPGLYRRLGLVPQQEAMFEAMSGRGFVELAARLHGLPSPRRAAIAALAVVELDPDDTRPLRAYSKGMRQRVKVAQAIVHDPEVVVLDEPLEGLDPRQRLHLITLFRRLGDEGRCVLVSSHVLDEVERFGSRVLVMSNGRLAAEGDFHAIRDLMDDRPHRVRVRTDKPHELAGALLAARAVVAARIEADDALIVDTVDAAALRRQVAPAAKDADARLLEVVPLDDDLESVFRYLVGR
ncbi:MAG: type transport system ATP-binding protein [Actinomycetota bacterium]|jgi:ABC-2 type transport system ATP-binding protein|nr:type transport system ATP-binding protein [Actinomycetota bacterium]